MTTASDICTNALQDLGVVALEETPSSAELAKALKKLNNMIETWNTESTMIYNYEALVFPFVANQAAYTLGTGGNWSTARPVKIVDITIRDQNNIDLPCKIATEQEYSAIITKTVASGFPICVYDDDNFPLKTLTFWPVPASANYSAALWAWLPLSSALTLATAVSLPPGYERALTSNLAIELAPSMGATASNELIQIALSSKQAIERENYKVRELGIDGTIPNRGAQGSAYAWYTGPYN